MSLVETEIAQARKQLALKGKPAGDFEFSINHLPPDPEAGAMFTERYEVTITHVTNGKSLELFGGIDLDWLSSFEEALDEGFFD